MRYKKKTLAIVTLGFLLLSMGLFTFWLSSGLPEERRSLAFPGTLMQRTIGIGLGKAVEVSPELAAVGVKASFIGCTVTEDTTTVLLRKESIYFYIQLTFLLDATDEHLLACRLIDESGNDLGVSSLEIRRRDVVQVGRKMEVTMNVAISDARLFDAARVLIITRSDVGKLSQH
jgi:hypothetical protein